MGRRKENKNIAITVRLDEDTAKFLDAKVEQMRGAVGKTANRNSLIEALIHKWKEEDDRYRKRVARTVRTPDSE
jgi:hypothetical protein